MTKVTIAPSIIAGDWLALGRSVETSRPAAPTPSTST